MAKPLPTSPSTLASRHAQVLELQLGGIVRGAQRVHDAAHVEALRVGVDDEAGDAAAALLGIGAREHQAEVRRVSAPEMNTLEPLMIQSLPSLHGARADGARGIAAARRLGEPEEAALLAAQHRMQVALLLLLGGLVELGEARRAEHAVAGRVEAGAMLGHLDRHQRARDEIDAGAAVLGGDVEAPEAHRRAPVCSAARSPRAAARWHRDRAWPRAARSPRARSGGRSPRSGAALRSARGSLAGRPASA